MVLLTDLELDFFKILRAFSNSDKLDFNLEPPLLIEEFKPVKMFVTIDVSTKAEHNHVIGLSIESSSDIGIDKGAVNIETINNRLSYIGSISNKIVIDGAFSDWKNSEVHIDIDNKGRGSILITETKKRYSKRIIIPERYILSAPTYKSFKNWIDHWRPRVENQNSRDALYLKPNGKPFTVRFLGKKLRENGTKVWPDFQPYVSRHWCAIALLIRTKLETKTWDTRRVQKYLGHEKPSTTDTYIEFAEEYYRQVPKDWFLHALRKQKNR